MKFILKFSLIPLLLHALTGHAALTVTNIARGCEANHSLFLKSDGSLWAMGANDGGQLGGGTYSTNSPYGTNRPEQMVASDVTAIAAGYDDSLFLKSDGSLWVMGANNEGQLGDGTYNRTNRPEQIVASGVKAIAAGGNNSPAGTGGGQSLFLKSDGSLWVMGNNSYGQLGDGTFTKTNQPEQIVAGGVVAIAAGGSHTLFLKSDGSLWAMGDNIYGQLGDGTHVYPYYTNQPEQIETSGVTAIAAGTLHSLFLKSDGSLWVMGYNDFGQLGDGFVDNYPRYGTAIPEPILPQPSPVLNSALSSTTNLQFKATCGFGGNFRLLGSTDITLPLSQWTPLNTNAISLRGTNNYSATLINAVNSGGQQFYILQSP